MTVERLREHRSLLPPDLAAEAFCYVTTRGRVTGRHHTIEIWFAADVADPADMADEAGTLYLLSGGGRRSDWVRNIEADPDVTVRIRDRRWRATGRIVSDPAERERASGLVVDKYQATYGGDLTRFRIEALPVALDLVAAEG